MKKLIIAFSLGIILFLFISLPLVSAEGGIENNVTFSGGFIQTFLSTNLSPLAVTIEAWIRPGDVNNKQVIVSIGNDIAGSRHYEFSIENGLLSFYYHFGPRSERILTGGVLFPNQWNHIAAVVSGTSSHIFVNGTEVVQDLGAPSLSPLSSNIVVGNTHLKNLQNPFAFIGILDELRISSVERDVKALWEEGAYGRTLSRDSGTLLLWHFNQPRGETYVVDDSENQLTGTFVGGDDKIHFSGLLPTPTQSLLITPTPIWNKPILPTLPVLFIEPSPSLPMPSPSLVFPTPVFSSIRQFLRRVW